MYSSAPVAGNDITAVGVGNIRKDALLNTETVIAGETIAAYTTAGSITFPTVVYLNGTKWYKANSNGTVLGAGYVQAVGLAVTAAAADGSTFTVAKPGSRITTELFPSISGITAGMNLFPSATTPGGISIFDSTTMRAYRLLGFVDSSNSFDFNPTDNNTLPSGKTIDYFTSGEAIAQYDTCFVSTDGLLYRCNTAFSNRAQPKKVLVAQHSVSGSGFQVRCKHSGITSINKGSQGFTTGLPVYITSNYGEVTTDNNGFVGSAVSKGREIGIAISTTQALLFDSGFTSEQIKIGLFVSGDIWAARDLLYFDKTTRTVKRADADVPASGIMEFPLIAVASNGTSGAPVACYLPGSVITGYGGFGAGDRLYPSSSPGGYTATFNPDLFQRCIGFVRDSDTVVFEPQEMLFLPTGIQEKGIFAVGVDGSGPAVNTVNFRKCMSNIPSSITFTIVNQLRLNIGPAAWTSMINKWGFDLGASFTGTAGQQGYVTGTFQTVGN